MCPSNAQETSVSSHTAKSVRCDPDICVADALPVNVQHSEISRRTQRFQLIPETRFVGTYRVMEHPVHSYETRFILQREVAGRSFRG